MLSSIRVIASWLACALLVAPAWAEDDSDSKRIEDVVVYGDRVESTVSDTSISITAMSEEFLMDMGIQGPDEMVNFIPATTRTDWDIKIRGIGRNFRGLGGDPGVGTYYNGIYSPDFGIASTEGGLYDIQRIEVLKVQCLDHRLTLLGHTKDHRRVTHTIHHRLGFFLTLRHIALRVQKVEAHEREIVVWEVPAVVHSRPQ